MPCGCDVPCNCFLTATNTVSITGDGSSGSPYQATVVPDPNGGLQNTPDGVAIKPDPASPAPVTVGPDGLSVGCCDPCVVDSDSIDFDVVAGCVTGDLRIDPSSTAPVSVTPDGLKVDCCGDTSTVADTDSINLSLAAGVITGDIILDPGGAADGGLETLANGVSVKVFGDPANVAVGTDQDCQLLRRTTAGDMYAKRPNYEIALLGGGQNNFPADGARHADGIDQSIVNRDDCDRLVMLSIQWQFKFTVAAGSYESDGTFFVDLTGGVTDSIFEGFEIGGTHVGGGQLKTHSQSKVAIFTLPAGATVHLDGYGIRSASDSNVDGSGGGNGLTIAVKAVVMDLAPGNLINVV